MAPLLMTVTTAMQTLRAGRLCRSVVRCERLPVSLSAQFWSLSVPPAPGACADRAPTLGPQGPAFYHYHTPLFSLPGEASFCPCRQARLPPQAWFLFHFIIAENG